MDSQNNSEPSIPAHNPENLNMAGVSALVYFATYSMSKLLTINSWISASADPRIITEDEINATLADRKNRSSLFLIFRRVAMRP